MKKKEEKRGQKAKKEKQGAIRSLSGKIERTAEPPVGQEESKKEAKSKGEKLHPRLQEVLDAIRSNSGAKEAMKDLVDAGCDEKALLTNLYFYCGGTKEQVEAGLVKAGLKAARKFRDQLGSISERLEEDADAIETIMKQLDKKGGIVIHSRDYAELPSTLRDLAELLARLGKGLQGGLEKCEDRKGRKYNGRTQPASGLSCTLGARCHKEGTLPRTRQTSCCCSGGH